jgi:hypothetical protein
VAARASAAQRNARKSAAMAVERLMGIGIGTTGFAGVVLSRVRFGRVRFSERIFECEDVC